MNIDKVFSGFIYKQRASVEKRYKQTEIKRFIYKINRNKKLCIQNQHKELRLAKAHKELMSTVKAGHQGPPWAPVDGRVSSSGRLIRQAGRVYQGFLSLSEGAKSGNIWSIFTFVKFRNWPNWGTVSAIIGIAGIPNTVVSRVENSRIIWIVYSKRCSSLILLLLCGVWII